MITRKVFWVNKVKSAFAGVGIYQIFSTTVDKFTDVTQTIYDLDEYVRDEIEKNLIASIRRMRATTNDEKIYWLFERDCFPEECNVVNVSYNLAIDAKIIELDNNSFVECWLDVQNQILNSSWATNIIRKYYPNHEFDDIPKILTYFAISATNDHPEKRKQIISAVEFGYRLRCYEPMLNEEEIQQKALEFLRTKGV